MRLVAASAVSVIVAATAAFAQSPHSGYGNWFGYGERGDLIVMTVKSRPGLMIGCKQGALSLALLSTEKRDDGLTAGDLQQDLADRDPAAPRPGRWLASTARPGSEAHARARGAHLGPVPGRAPCRPSSPHTGADRSGATRAPAGYARTRPHRAGTAARAPWSCRRSRWTGRSCSHWRSAPGRSARPRTGPDGHR